ncbi:MAG TPA: ATP-binding protein, partial [Cryomorphaceae bacterium]|nr:ATP-binding protein [Cryomorphaceae bacterium]
ERNAHYLELGLTLNNIGEVYREQFTDYEMAEKHYRKAIAINKKHGFKSGLAANYLNLALTFDIREQIDSAFHYANLAKNIRFETGDIGGLAIIHNALGQINLHDGDFQAARKAFSETIRISKEHQIYPGLFYGNWGLGETYSAKGAHNIAKEYYEIALATAERLKSKPMIADTHQSLYELERELGDFQSALNHFELYKSYSDSIRMKQNENEFAELKTIYETDLAHTVNMLLKATQESQNAELRRQRTTAIGLWVLLGLVVIIAVILYIGYDRRSKSLQKEAALNQELQKQYHTVNLQKEELKKLDDLKNKIFSVLGHDLRAPLTSISSLMRLIHSKHLDAQEFARLTEHLDNETRAGLTSLQNILDWSQIKAGNEKTQIEELSVGPIINEFLINNRRQLDEKNIEVSTNWDETPTITADKNQFKSITTNLISNAIKFSPPGGKIYLQTIRESKGVRFIVRDTGEGISDDLITKLNSNEKIVSKRGTSGEKGTGIGLRIAKDFAELHGGRLTFKNADGGGTAVEVFFPSEVKHFKVSA